jgi:DNA polymerase
LVFVGEAPGAQEDASGVPFVGRAGQLLDQLLADAGLDRQQVAILNVLKCRPPGNRKPANDEVERCRPWLSAQLDALAPELIVTLGLSATAWFLGRRIQIGRVRGSVHEVEGRRVLPTYHPSGALRFGPAGAPMQALRSDLELAAALLTAGDVS